MYYDTAAMGGLTSTEKAIVATHEFGHAYGLGHSDLGCSGLGPAVMKTGTSKFSCSGTPPWPNDVGGCVPRELVWVSFALASKCRTSNGSSGLTSSAM